MSTFTTTTGLSTTGLSTTGLSALAAAFLLTASTAGHAHKDRDDPEQRRAKIQQVVETKLAPRLELDDRQAAQLVEVMERVATERRQARQLMRAEHKTLKKLVEAGASEEALIAQMQAVQAARESAHQTPRMLDDTARFLSVEQQAKLTLMRPKMMKHGKRHGHHGKRGKRGKHGKIDRDD